MTKRMPAAVASLGLMLGVGLAGAQAPAAAPAGATGICKDGTYSMAGSKSGACRGHQGVQTWYAATAPTADGTKGVSGAAAAGTMPAPKATGAAAAMPAPKAATSAPAAMPAPTTGSVASSAPAAGKSKAGPAASAAAKAQAPGGGPGLVWVNTESNVYHCNGDTYYGKTKAGQYMSEADAKAKGAHGDHGKSCAGK